MRFHNPLFSLCSLTALLCVGTTAYAGDDAPVAAARAVAASPNPTPAAAAAPPTDKRHKADPNAPGQAPGDQPVRTLTPAGEAKANPAGTEPGGPPAADPKLPQPAIDARAAAIQAYAKARVAFDEAQTAAEAAGRAAEADAKAAVKDKKAEAREALHKAREDALAALKAAREALNALRDGAARGLTEAERETLDKRLAEKDASRAADRAARAEKHREAVKKAHGHALEKPAVHSELTRHAWAIARLERVIEVAEASSRPEDAARARGLLEKEQKAHEAKVKALAAEGGAK